MKTYSNKNHVVIVINNYTDAVIARKFLEYVLMVEEDVTYDNLVGKFATPTESKYALYRISSIRKDIKLVQSYISKVETAHGAEVEPTEVEILMDAESYNRYVKEFMQATTSMIATI